MILAFTTLFCGDDKAAAIDRFWPVLGSCSGREHAACWMSVATGGIIIIDEDCTAHNESAFWIKSANLKTHNHDGKIVLKIFRAPDKKLYV